MKLSTSRLLLSLLAGIYLFGCEAAVLRLTSFWTSTGAEASVNSTHSGSGKAFPNLSGPQRRSHLPLVAFSTFVSPPATNRGEYNVEGVWLYPVTGRCTQVHYQTLLFSASDSSPPQVA